MGKILYLPNTHHELRLIPGLAHALKEPRYEIVRCPDSLFRKLFRQLKLPVGFIRLFKRDWAREWT